MIDKILSNINYIQFENKFLTNFFLNVLYTMNFLMLYSITFLGGTATFIKFYSNIDYEEFNKDFMPLLLTVSNLFNAYIFFIGINPYTEFKLSDFITGILIVADYHIKSSNEFYCLLVFTLFFVIYTLTVQMEVRKTINMMIIIFNYDKLAIFLLATILFFFGTLLLKSLIENLEYPVWVNVILLFITTYMNIKTLVFIRIGLMFNILKQFNNTIQNHIVEDVIFVLLNCMFVYSK